MAFERVGLQVVLQGVGQYVAGANQVSRANAMMGTSFGAVERSGVGIISLIGRMGVAVTALGVAVTGMATIAGSKFETTFAQIDVLTNTTREDTDKLRGSILEMTKVVPKSPDELGAAAYFALSRGITDVDEAQKVVLNSAKAASVGLGETQDIVKLVTGVLNAYGKEAYTAERVTDILVQGVKEGGAEAKEYAKELGDLLGIAAELKVPFEEVVGIFAQLTNVMSAPESATGLKGILVQLGSPSKEALKTLKEFDISYDAILESIKTKGLPATLNDLRKAFDGNTLALSKILPDVRGFNAFLLATGPSARQAADALDRIRKATGTTEEAFQRMSQTAAFQFGLLKNQLNVALINLGTAVLPLVNRAVTEAIVLWPKLEAVIERVGRLVSLGFGGGSIGGEIKGWEQAVFDFGRVARDVFDFLQSAAPTALDLFLRGVEGGATAVGLLSDALQWFLDNEAALVGALGAIGAFFVISNPVWAGILAGGAILVGIGLLQAELETLSDPLLIFRREIQLAIADLLDFANKVSTLGLNSLPGTRDLLKAAGVDQPLGDAGNYREAAKRTQDQLQRNAEERAQSQERERIKKNNQQLAKDAGITYEKFLADQITAYTKANDQVLDLTDPYVKRLVDEYTELTKSGTAAATTTQKNNQLAGTARQQQDALGRSIAGTGSAAGKSKEEIEEWAKALEKALSDDVINLSEQGQLGISPQEAARQELAHRTAEALNAEAEAQNRLQVTSIQAKLAIEQGGMAYQRFTAQLAKTALELNQTAFGELLGKPSREQANAMVRLAELQLAAANAQIRGGQVPKALQAQLDRIQAEIAVFGAKDQLSRARQQAADKTLLSEQERQKQIDATIRKTGEFSGALQSSNDKIYKGFNPALDAAAAAARNFQAAANTPRPRGRDEDDGPPRIGHATGGIFRREHAAIISEGNKPEAIIPLTDPVRAGRILAAIGVGGGGGGGSVLAQVGAGGFAKGLVNAIGSGGGGGGGSVLAPIAQKDPYGFGGSLPFNPAPPGGGATQPVNFNFSATGMSLEDLRAAMINQVNQYFNQAIQGRSLSGNRSTTIVGPGRF